MMDLRRNTIVSLRLGDLTLPSAETWFLVFALPIGLFLLFAVPPTQGTDEPNHFYRAYTISSGAFVAPLSGGRASGLISACLKAYVEFQFAPAPTQDRFHPGAFARQPKSCSNGDTARVYFENTAFNSPVPYLPQVLAISIGRFLGAPIPALFYAGRVAAFMAFVVILHLALRIAPAGHSVLLILGLWPMSLLLATTYSADTMTIALAALAVACILRVRLDSSAGTGILAITLAAIAGLALSKNTYYVLAPLIFLVPIRQLRSPARVFAARAAALGAVMLLALVWYLQARDWGNGMSAYFAPGTIDPAAQTKLVVGQPLWFLKFVADNLFGQRLGYFTWQTFVAQVGFFRNPAVGQPSPPPWVFALGYVLIAWAYAREAQHPFVWSPRRIAEALIPLILVLLNVLAIFTVLFVVAWPVGIYAMPVQGRYLLPLSAIPLISLFAVSRMSPRRLSMVPLLAPVLLIHAWLAVKVLALFYS
jgi:uncharacterized membrane protein